MASVERELLEQLDAPKPESWRPDDPASGHPNVLVGELAMVDEHRTVWGDRQIAVVKDLSGKLWSVWLMQQVLIDEFIRQQPKIGEMLAIRYDGIVERDPGEGRPYKKYRLVIRRDRGQTVEWKGGDAASPAPFAGIEQPQPEPDPPDEPLPPAAEAEPKCEACGFLNGFHAQGCPNDIPF